jgi:hypothetical protein
LPVGDHRLIRDHLIPGSQFKEFSHRPHAEGPFEIHCLAPVRRPPQPLKGKRLVISSRHSLRIVELPNQKTKLHTRAAMIRWPRDEGCPYRALTSTCGTTLHGSVDLGKLVVIEDVEEFGAEIEEGPSPYCRPL